MGPTNLPLSCPALPSVSPSLPSEGALREPCFALWRGPQKAWPSNLHPESPKTCLGLPTGPARRGYSRTVNGSVWGKGHFGLNVLSRLEPALVKSLALLGGLSWSVSRPCPLPTINQSCSKLAQMQGDSVQIQLWFGSHSHAWLHVGPGLLDRMQPPGLHRALFPSAASPQSPHTCLPLWCLGQPGRIRHRQQPAAPAGSSHFIFPAVLGYGSPCAPPLQPLCLRGGVCALCLCWAEAVKLVTVLSCSMLGADQWCSSPALPPEPGRAVGIPLLSPVCCEVGLGALAGCFWNALCAST